MAFVWNQGTMGANTFLELDFKTVLGWYSATPVTAGGVAIGETLYSLETYKTSGKHVNDKSLFITSFLKTFAPFARLWE